MFLPSRLSITAKFRPRACVSGDVVTIVRQQVLETDRQRAGLTICLQLGACSPMLPVRLVDFFVVVLLLSPGLLHILRQQAGETLGDHCRMPRAWFCCAGRLYPSYWPRKRGQIEGTTD